MKPANETQRIANWNKLIDALRKGLPNVQFDMRHWSKKLGSFSNPCGTAACIGGHVGLVLGESIASNGVAAWLGLTQETSHPLFFGTPAMTGFASGQIAADFLESIKDTPPGTAYSMQQAIINFLVERKLSYETE